MDDSFLHKECKSNIRAKNERIHELEQEVHSLEVKLKNIRASYARQASLVNELKREKRSDQRKLSKIFTLLHPDWSKLRNRMNILSLMRDLVAPNDQDGQTTDRSINEDLLDFDDDSEDEMLLDSRSNDRHMTPSSGRFSPKRLFSFIRKDDVKG